MLLIFSGCGHRGGRPLPDVSDSEVNLEFIRLEQLLFEGNKQQYEQSLAGLRQTHPEVIDFYLYDLMGLPYDVPNSVSDSMFYAEFVARDQMQALHDTVEVVYNDFSREEQQLEQAFKYCNYYFPEVDIPVMFTYISAFTYQTVIAEKMIGIELDMFMGKDFSIYNKLSQIPRYMLPRLTADYLPVSVMLVQAGDLTFRNFDENNVLNHLIYEGKMLYFIDRVLPDTDDPIKIGYTDAQLKWCEDNARDIWDYLVSEELLFSKSTDDIAAIVGDGPTTKGMPPESPGRVGAWVGWQIVRSYMDKHREVTLSELFDDMDAMQILQQSKYRP